MSSDFSFELLIRESYLDTFGHVNNAAYLQIFEDARWEYISRRNYTLDYIKKCQKGPVILEIDLKFKREVCLREKVKIEISLLEYNKKIGKLLQKMIKESGEVACEGVFTFALFDLVERKIILPTPEWMQAIQ